MAYKKVVFAKYAGQQTGSQNLASGREQRNGNKNRDRDRAYGTYLTRFGIKTIS